MTSKPSIGINHYLSNQRIRYIGSSSYEKYNEIDAYYNNEYSRYGKIFNPNFLFTKNEKMYGDLKYSRLFDVATTTLSNVKATSPNINANTYNDGNTKKADSYNIFNKNAMLDVDFKRNETEINGVNYKTYYIDKNGNKVGKNLNKLQGGDYIEYTITLKSRDNSSSDINKSIFKNCEMGNFRK